MADDTKVFQDMADSMLPLFDNMPQVVVVVGDSEWFHRDSYPVAYYSSPNILINPSYAMLCSFPDMKGVICHELIHAWVEWKGLLGRGEHFDEHHSELFVKKALEINQKRIPNLYVDVDYYLKTHKHMDLYNRIAGIRFAPYLRHKVRKKAKTVISFIKEIVDAFLEYQSVPKIVVISLSVVAITVVLRQIRLIPNAVASFVVIGWAVGALVWHAVVMIRQRTR